MCTITCVCVCMWVLFVSLCDLRLCYAQSHSDDSHLQATTLRMSCICSHSGSPHNVMHSSSVIWCTIIVGTHSFSSLPYTVSTVVCRLDEGAPSNTATVANHSTLCMNAIILPHSLHSTYQYLTLEWFATAAALIGIPSTNLQTPVT